MNDNFHAFEDRARASEAAARWIAGALERALASPGRASFVVSGGSTPVDCFRQLSGMPLPWGRVSVFMSDERCVPLDHADSNEAMVRSTLATGAAADLEVVSVYREGQDAQALCAALEQRVRSETDGFAAVLLGMGDDGHFASLFPDDEQLDAGLEPDGRPACLPVVTAASPHPRITLTLSALVRTRELILLAFGSAKRAVLEDAAAGRGHYPVQALLDQDRTPVKIAWAP